MLVAPPGFSEHIFSHTHHPRKRVAVSVAHLPDCDSMHPNLMCALASQKVFVAKPDSLYPCIAIRCRPSSAAYSHCTKGIQCIFNRCAQLPAACDQVSHYGKASTLCVTALPFAVLSPNPLQPLSRCCIMGEEERPAASDDDGGSATMPSSPAADYKLTPDGLLVPPPGAVQLGDKLQPIVEQLERGTLSPGAVPFIFTRGTIDVEPLKVGCTIDESLERLFVRDSIVFAAWEVIAFQQAYLDGLLSTNSVGV